MLKAYMMPTPSEASNDTSNSINSIVLHLRDHLPTFGVELVENRAIADLVIANAGQSDGVTVPDVSMCHGVYPTAGGGANETPGWWYAANAHVISNLLHAKRITVPSEWVADILRRDLHVNPDVIGWAIDFDEWEPGENQNYVLWAKTRPDRVCDPTPLNELAKRVGNQQFVTTFGNQASNVRIIGRQPFDQMKPFIRNAGVMLCNVKETFGVATLEAMACGVPILGFNWGGTADLVKHGVNGFLCSPGDIDGLREGLDYCLKYRDVLGANGREMARQYTWDSVAEKFARLYQEVLIPHEGPKVSVVIPCHNYEQYVGQAIDSVKSQVATFPVEIIVVLDRCTDNSESVVLEHLCDYPHADIATVDFGNPADTRNRGIEMASGEFICALDADDMLGDPRYLQILVDELVADRSLGLVFTGLRTMDKDGNLGNPSQWPSGYDFELQCTRRNQVPTCNVFRKEAWIRGGGYRRRYCPAEDAELWLRMGIVGYRMKQVTTEPWFVYRLHGDSLSSTIRTGERPEPDWILDKPWLANGQRPFAADGRVPNHSWPVRNYDQPRVSFIIPCTFKHRTLLQDALDSVESQTIRDWECIVVNDSDQPLCLPGYPWVRIVNTDKRGAGHARNLGIAAAKAPLISFLDADDSLSPRFLDLTLRAYARTGRYVYTDWVSLSLTGVMEPHETPDFEPGLVFHQTSIHAINVLIAKADVLQVGGFDEDMAAWEDVDLFMKLAVAGVCGIRVADKLVMYRYQTGSLREHGETIKQELLTLLRTRYKDYIEDKAVCGCTEPKKRKQGIDDQAGKTGQDEMIRIEYNGPEVPTGQHNVIGIITKQNYGRRKAGDVFYVFKKDQAAATDRFIPIQDVIQTINPTPVPPEPEPIKQAV